MGPDKKLFAGDGRDVDEVWLERVNRMRDLFHAEKPDIFLVELYPLGRKAFRRELDPILAGIRLGSLPDCRVYCSVRDILVGKPDQTAYETRVCRDLNRWFDGLLVHADPSLVALDDTFGQVAAITIPVIYTGYVARTGPRELRRASFREREGIADDDTLVVVSAGGGQSGYPLLSAVLAARHRLAPETRLHLAVFTGPYLPQAKLAALQAEAAPGVAIQRFSPDFTAWLAAADLSISMAGYNTCMNLLTAGVPALVWPFKGDQEQPLRAKRLEAAGWLAVLENRDLEPGRLADRMAAALQRPPTPDRPIDLDGARRTARYLEEDRPPRKSVSRRAPVRRFVVYCQHLLGVGHFFRTLEICRALAAHDIILVTGGQELPAVLPDNVRLRKLPELITDRAFQHLHAPGGETLEAIRAERHRRLRAILREEAPDMFLIELYPIGRKAFRFELDPLLADIAEGRLPACPVICSVRDILVEKEDTRRHETRAVDVLNRWFDALLVHADPAVVRLEATFSRLDTIRIPVVYTGYVAPTPAPPPDRAAWRQARGIGPAETLVVVSAGGGAVGYPLLSAALQAVRHIPADFPIRVQVFTGPFLPKNENRALRYNDDPRVRIDPFTDDFQSWLNAADLSLSMAGYNTCMAILAAGIRAMVLPFAQNREQAMRARLLEERGLLTMLTEDDLAPSVLAARIRQQLSGARPRDTAPIDIAGAAHTAGWIESYLARGGSAT
jgi:predicted glycosyltransferase